MSRCPRRLLLGLAMLAVLPSGAMGQSLTMGLGSPVSSLDPHYHLLRSNGEVAQMLFDTLLTTDAEARLHPGLAESWRPVGTEAWEFTLREGVRFHDGTPLVPEDIAFTFERIPQVRGPGASYTTHIRPVSRVEILDERRLRLHTSRPAPLLPTYLSQVVILSRRLHAGGTTADFNSGKLAVGTGPFRLASYAAGDRIALVRNEAYWGERPDWASVTYRMITNDAGRTAALLAGDVDFIDQVPTSDIERFRTDRRFRLAETTSLRVMYVTLDGTRPPPVPLLTAANGGPLDANPLADLRVRRALAMAIDRRLLVERVMQGAALATTQFMPPGTYGALPDRPVPAAEPEGAPLADGGRLSAGLCTHADGLQRPLHERCAGGAGARPDVDPHRHPHHGRGAALCQLHQPGDPARGTGGAAHLGQFHRRGLGPAEFRATYSRQRGRPWRRQPAALFQPGDGRAGGGGRGGDG
jgi:peptide/nickel transport system substrate-binding protein